jgi:aryl-alcohol dehydrogenase-like predicted oxidoreductase
MDAAAPAVALGRTGLRVSALSLGTGLVLLGEELRNG